MDQVRGSVNRYLRMYGERIVVNIPEFFRESGLKFLVNKNSTAVLVPLDITIRASFQVIEKYIQENITDGQYKPLWLKDAMYVNVSKWCEYIYIGNEGVRSPVQPGTTLSKGFYSMDINVSHLYMGPHKGGETHSLSLHVTKITYRPGEDILGLIESLSQNFDPTAKPDIMPLEKIPKKKGGRSKKGGEQTKIKSTTA